MRIFSSKILSDQDRAALPTQCNLYREADFIRIDHQVAAPVRAALSTLQDQALRVIITSKQAVISLQKHLDRKPRLWDVWCIAPATRQLCVAWLGEESIQASAFDAETLKHTLIHESYVFFRGNVASDVLPEYCRAQQINLKQLEVYQQFPQPQAISETFDYYLFFSPSAVDSFYSKNKLPASSTAIAIGNATQARLQKYGHKLIFTAAAPSAQAMFETIEYEHAKK